MKRVFFAKKVVEGLFVSSLLASSSVFAVPLPSVSACSFGPGNLMCYTTSSGAELYVASKHDDFVSYGVNAISTYIGLGYTGLTDFSNGLGSGSLLKLFTYNNANNGTFPDANSGTPTGGGSGNDSFVGTWPVASAIFTIAQLKTYLGLGTTPVFGFDLAEPQTAGDTGLQLNGQMVVSSSTGTEKDTFAFDNVLNSAYDSGSLVEAAVSQSIQWKDLTGCPTGSTAGVGGLCSMVISNDVGGGGAEFYAFAPGFNVGNFLDTDIITVTLRMQALDGAGDELFLANGVTAPSASQVPEPGSLALVALGLLGLGLMRERGVKR